MGVSNHDSMAGDRKFSARYALDSPAGIRQLLGEYHALVDRQYKGDYDAVGILIDLTTAIKRAGLTERQLEALRLVFIDDLTQKEAGAAMGVRQDAVSQFVKGSLIKIAAVYESWAWRDEGYSLTRSRRVENTVRVAKVPCGHSYVTIKHGKWRTVG